MHKGSIARRALATSGLLAASLLLCAASRGVAQDARRFRVGPSLGVAFFPSDVERVLGTGEITLSLDPALLVGIEVGYLITDDWELGAFLSFAQPNVNGSPPPDPPGTQDTKFWGGNISYYLGQAGRPRPFLTAGAGATVNGSGFDDMHFAVNFGAGVALPISSRLSFRLDTRDHISTDRFGGGTQHDVLAKLGADFRF